jgi:hypothetical protein
LESRAASDAVSFREVNSGTHADERRTAVKSKALCVLGMHRSGTSAMTGVLHCLGVSLGRRLVPAGRGVNERGFWEHDDVVDIHQRMLWALRFAWDDVRPLPENWWVSDLIQPYREELIATLRRDFAGVPLWAVKDPRTCRLLPLWLGIMDQLGCEPLFVLIYRHPVEVARSLERRDHFSSEKSALLWVDHNLSAERWTRDRPRVFVAFDELFDDVEATVNRISSTLNCSWPVPLDKAIPKAKAFLAPKLRHQVADQRREQPFSSLSESLLSETWETLCSAAAGDTVQVRARFDELSRRLAVRVSSFDPAVVGHIADLQRRQARMKARLDDLYSSMSWRVTRPLRGLAWFSRSLYGLHSSMSWRIVQSLRGIGWLARSRFKGSE